MVEGLSFAELTRLTGVPLLAEESLVPA